MKCSEMRPLISALVDGELTADEQRDVREHLSGCSECRAFEEDLRAASALVAQHAPRPRMDELSWARFESALAAEPPRGSLPRGAGEGRGGGLLVGVAALIAATLGLSLFLTIRPDTIVFAMPRPHLPPLAYSDPIVNVAKAVALPHGLEGVANAAAATALSAPQRAALERDGLVQTTDSARSLVDFYGRPDSLVTADAALLVWGGAVSRASLEVEREHLAPALRATLEHLDRTLGRFEVDAPSENVLRAAQLARRIVAVARGEDRDPLVREDLAKIHAAQGRSVSAVLGRELDWTRFAPRGPLVALPEHLRAVTWLGEASLALDAAHPDELRAALLMGLALARSPEVLARFVDLDEAASLLHGPADELGIVELLDVIRNVFGTSVRLDLVGKDEALAAVAARAKAVAKASHASGTSFRLMGGARSIEQLVLSALSSDKLPGRARPSSLDLLAAIGSEAARAVASSEGVPGYATALDALADELGSVTQVPRAVSRAGSGVERSKLFALSKLVARPRAGTAAMESQAYADRRLLAALAALNVPAAAREDGALVYDASAPLPAVEPLPALYARLAHGAHRLALGLSVTTPAAVRATARLDRLSELLAGLAVAARETLSGAPLTEDARRALGSFASAARVFAPERIESVEDIHVIVKVDGSRVTLERSTGPLDRLWLVLPDAQGTTHLVSGPALSARESEGARAPRTDPSWASHIVR